MSLALSVPARFAEFGTCIWIIANVSNKEVLGHLTLIKNGAAVELHIGVIKRHAGKGNATNAIRLACKSLRDELKFKEVVSYINVEHLAAQAAFQKRVSA